jgi:hypothetical protein
MRWLASLTFWLVAAALCQAQEVTFREAKNEIRAAREKVTQVVTFCSRCDLTGKLEGTECPYCGGYGATLKSEGEMIRHRTHLTDRAARAGAELEEHAQFDVAKRLAAFEEKLEPETRELLPAYVGYVKAYEKHKAVVKEDEKLVQRIAREIELLDEIIDRHGARLRIESVRLLYADDPVGKIGAFRFYGKTAEVKIDGQPADVIELRTLKDCAILLLKTKAKQRKGFVLGEIVGKDTYQTDDGKSIKAIMIRPW